MSKKRRNDPEEVLRNFDPAIEKLAVDRLLTGKQLFDYETHRLRPNIRDEAQARAILLRAQDLAKQLDKKLVLRFFEKRLLARTYEEQITRLIALLFGFCTLGYLIDETCDGLPDEFQFYEHVLFDHINDLNNLSDAKVQRNHKYYFHTNLYVFCTNLYEKRTNLYGTDTVSSATAIF